MLEEVHQGKKIDCNSKNQASWGMFMYKQEKQGPTYKE